MLRNKNASLGGRTLSNITQVKKVLLGMKDLKEIFYFEKIENRLDNEISLSYKIFLKPDMFFCLVIRPAYSFHPVKGAEWGDGNGHEATVLIDKGCKPRRIREIVREVIQIFKEGWKTEESCHRDIVYLIKTDKEVKKKIKDIILPSEAEDMNEGIDRFLVCVDGKKVPLQIKNGFLQSQKHKEAKHPSPLIHYKPELLSSGLLKRYILDIVDSYPEFIRYCI